ncbi:MAG: hypothetical protein MJZ48_02290 [Paludibacteraceae bacterium]|nr:hypothetical protein [Paludibacteraceae bacterium]
MIIAVDFDGTIVEHAYPQIGKPIPFAIDTLKRLQQEQHQIILWSVREGKLLQEAVDYCKGRGFEFFAVNSNFPDENEIHDGRTARKLTADLFIDDRNLGGLPDWGVIYQMIHSGNALRPIPAEGLVQQEVKHKKRSLLQRLFQ